MKIFFVSAVLLAVAATGVYSQACHMREVDLCLAIGMFHYQSNGVPADEEKLVEWCETMQEVSDCMGNFSAKCLSPLQKEIMTLMSGAEDSSNQLCVAGSDMRARYLKHAECLSEGAETDESKSHLTDMKAVVEKLFDVPYKQRYPVLCCGFGRFHYDSETSTSRRCGEDSVEMLRTIIRMVFTDIPTTICQRFDGKSDECESMLPPRGTPTKGGENKSQLVKLLDTVLGNN